MKLISCVLIALFTCTAATCDTKPSKAVNIHCDALCFASCDPLVAWDGDRDGERLSALMDAHDAQHSECDQHRAACVACISTARKAKAIQ